MVRDSNGERLGWEQRLHPTWWREPGWSAAVAVIPVDWSQSHDGSGVIMTIKGVTRGEDGSLQPAEMVQEKQYSGVLASHLGACTSEGGREGGREVQES